MMNWYQNLKRKSIPSSLQGTYARWMGGPPDEEGITYLPTQDIANTVVGEDLHPLGFRGTAFAPDAVSGYQEFEPDQRAFINTVRAENWARETGVPPWVIDEVLRGHELHHANSLMIGRPVGNKGQQATRDRFPNRNRTGLEDTPAATERFLTGYPQRARSDTGYKFGPPLRDVERGAERAGAERLRQLMLLREIFNNRP